MIDDLLGAAASVEPLRVLLCDGHPLFRRALLTALEDVGVEVVAEAETVDDALTLAVEQAPDVVVLDLGLPGGRSVDLVARLFVARPGLAVVGLAGGTDEATAFAALRLGASSVIYKEDALAQAPSVVLGAGRGNLALPPMMAGRVLAAFEEISAAEPFASSPDPGLSLSSRERAVLSHLRDRPSVVAAGIALGLPAGTVRNLSRNALVKLQRNTRNQALVRVALR